MTVSEKLRLVYGLHHHAEMFGFNWDDDSDWTWHDVACKIADEVDAENAKLRELVCWMYDLMDESCAVQHPYAPAPISYDRLLQAQARARELGIEVTE